MVGDHTLFTTADGIERLWEVSAPLLERPSPLHAYAPGSWGPEAMQALIAPHSWRLPFARRWRGGATARHLRDCGRVTPALSVAALHKRYGRTTALDGVDLDVGRASWSACSGPTAPASRRS